ncbi:DUF1835 domain-containing protein [Parabacteroides sp. OttesenSCG-928-J18]|nr:DUF1835 domain-containing protein [Parabacteroides sp. OttesenSCG-928-J18]
MKHTDIHIVFGQSAKGLFVHSEKFDLDSILLICLEDCLNIGPICDLASLEEVEARKRWLSKRFDIPKYINEDDFLMSTNRDIETIKSLVENYKNEKIYLWTGVSPLEIIQTARLLYHLKPDCNNVFTFDFYNFSMKNVFGTVVYPNCLGATDLSRVDDLDKHFCQLTEGKLSEYRKIWEKVKFGNSLLWILDENKQLVAKDETYFDSFLLSHCTDEYQKPAIVIGHTLCDTDFNVRDVFLAYRMKQLVLTGKLQIHGELKEMRDYEVKLNKE